MTVTDERLADAEWLEKAAHYFEKRDTGGEDMAFWANVANAERCRSIAQSLRAQGGVRVSGGIGQTAFNAVLNCPHEIAHNRVVLKVDHSKEGNALAQLHARLASLEASPAPVSEEMVRASDVSGPVPADHPLMVAWTAYVSTDEYANTFRWAQHEEHRRGSLWAAFDQGYRAALAAKGGQ